MSRGIAAAAGGLIVSVQAPTGSPLDHDECIARMAASAVLAGAAGLRINSSAHVAATRAFVGPQTPIIGLAKHQIGAVNWITPTVEDAAALATAGADLIAIDAARDPRPDGRTVAETIAVIQDQLRVPVMADIDTYEAALAAVDAGAAVIATTLAGYTDRTVDSSSPDLQLLERLAQVVEVPLIAEGNYSTPELVAAAYRAGATSVVVGRSVTDPMHITERFVAATPRSVGHDGGGREGPR